MITFKLNKKYYAFFIIYIAFLFFVAFECSSASSLRTYAETVNFENTAVLDDLRSSYVNNKKFELSNYPFNANDEKLYVINLVEYCYAFDMRSQSNYGLFVYVYNPSAMAMKPDDGKVPNKITLATSYDAEGLPNSYDDFDLKLCDTSAEPGYLNVFLKFKIVDKKGKDGKFIVQRVDPEHRRYDLSEILIHDIWQVSLSTTVGKTYKFSGHASGYGANPASESTLRTSINEMETYPLQRYNGADSDFSNNDYFDVTNFRAFGGDNVAELNSVYFTLDNKIMEKYKKLQKIKANWWQFTTSPIVVTKDKALFDALKPFEGKQVLDYKTSGLKWGLYAPTMNGADVLPTYDWGYNINSDSLNTVHDISHKLSNVFYAGDGVSDIFKFSLPKNVLENHLKNYPIGESGSVDINGRKFSKDLFSGLNDDINKHYVFKNFDTDDKDDLFNLTSDDVRVSWLNKIFGNTSWQAQNYSGINPIFMFPKDYEFAPNNESVSKSLFINENDVGIFKEFYTKALRNDKTVFLFRYASSNYFSKKLQVWDHTDNGIIQHPKSDTAYMAKEDIFLDWEILEFTFNKDGQLIVIPVVMSPIDVINDVTHPVVPSPGIDWDAIKELLQKIFMIVVLVVILVVIMPFVPLILRVVVFVVSFPFKAVKFIFGAFKPKKKYKNRR